MRDGTRYCLGFNLLIFLNLVIASNVLSTMFIDSANSDIALKFLVASLPLILIYCVVISLIKIGQINCLDEEVVDGSSSSKNDKEILTTIESFMQNSKMTSVLLFASMAILIILRLLGQAFKTDEAKEVSPYSKND